MSTPRAWAVSSSQINITWVAPDPITEIRGNVKMYQVVWIKQNTDTEYNVPAEEDVVSIVFSFGIANNIFMCIPKS